MPPDESKGSQLDAIGSLAQRQLDNTARRVQKHKRTQDQRAGTFRIGQAQATLDLIELEYVSDRDGGFKQPLERCKLLTRWAFEYFDQTPQVKFGSGGSSLFGALVGQLMFTIARVDGVAVCSGRIAAGGWTTYGPECSRPSPKPGGGMCPTRSHGTKKCIFDTTRCVA